MITVGSKDSCSFCLQILPKKDGWIPCCKAFPDGIPDNILNEVIKVTEIESCNAGIKFTPDVEAQNRLWSKSKNN